MSEAEQDFAILFSDLAGSSQLYSQLGNHEAELRIHKIIQTLTLCCGSYPGKLIKTIGNKISTIHSVQQ